VADIRKKSDTAWLVRWREDGKQRYKQFRKEDEAVAFKKERDGDALGRKIMAAPLTGSAAAWFGGGSPAEATEDRWSVAGYARRMVEADASLANSTKFTYLRAIDKHFADTGLGRADVREVTTETIRDWWAALPEGARWDSYRLLSKIVNRALTVGDREDNPLKRAPEIRKPRRGREVDFDPLTASQIEDLADAALKATKGLPMAHERDRLLILVMGFAGLRAGEAGGLRRQDLIRTGDRCQLRLRQQVVRDTPKEAPHLAPLKTRSSRRTITIACSLFEELVDFCDRYPPAEDGRIFHGANGEARDHQLINGMVHRAARRAGMTGVHSHLLRHSAVSLLINAGANAKQVQAFAGHADVSVTLGTYSHLFDSAGTELADIMERLRREHRDGR